MQRNRCTLSELRRLAQQGDRDALLEFIRANPMSGGDGLEPIYPSIPDDVSGLSDEELATLESELVDLVKRVGDQDADLVGDRDAETIIEQTAAAVEAVGRIRTEKAEREQRDQEAAERLAELVGKVAPPAGDSKPAEGEGDAKAPEGDEGDAPDAPEGDAKPAEGEGDKPAEEPLPLAASARRRSLPPLPARRNQNRPRPESDAGVRQPTIVAAADLPGHPLGTKMPDMTAVAQAIIDRRMAMGNVQNGDKVLVASVQYPFEDARMLKRGEDATNAAKLRAVTSPQAITAAGGICVLPTPIYDVNTFGINDRPVTNSIARFGADRGGIIFYPPVSWRNEDPDSIGIISNAEALAGGSSSLKTCGVIDCPDTVTVFVDSIYRCVEINNLEARTFPERVAAVMSNLQVMQAQLAELYALAAIDAASTHVTAAAPSGVVVSLFGIIGVQAASMRSRLRLGPEVTLRVILPAWSLDLLVQDLIRGQFDRFSRDRAGVESLLRQMLNVNITFELDDEVFGAQAAGATLAWPTTVTMRMFPEGSFIHLDSGQLDLGLVRDTSTNQRNAYQLFAETFEGFAFNGIESRKVTISGLRPTGQIGVNADPTFPNPTV